MSNVEQFLSDVKEFRKYLNQKFETLVQIKYSDHSVDVYFYIKKPTEVDLILDDGWVFNFDVEICIDKSRGSQDHPLHFILEDAIFSHFLISDIEYGACLQLDFIKEIKRRNDELWARFKKLTEDDRESIREFCEL